MSLKTKSSTQSRAALNVELARAELTQTALAMKLGVSPTSLSGWLCGRHPAPTDLVERIERVLKIPRGTLSAGGSR